jgi:subtilisin family serine protease
MKGAPARLVHPDGETLVLDPTRAVLGFNEARRAQQLQQGLERAGLVFEDADEKVTRRGPFGRVNNSPNRYWVRSRSGSAIDEKALDVLEYDWVGSVYRSHRAEGDAGLLSILPTTLLVRATSRERVAQRLSKYGLKEVPSKSEYLGPYQYFTVTKPKDKDALEIRDELLSKEKDLIRDVRFETIPMIVPTAMVPNDVHFPQQWNMTQVRAGGPGQTGWDISIGVAGVVICVLDEGCDPAHPDLQLSGPGINLGTMAPPGSPTGNHGTACAGIAAATINNGGEGVAGMAGGCRVLPAAFDTWSDVEVAAGINFATAAGARVISMSFGWNPWDHNIIDPAIQTAFNNNVVMCVATHNHNGAITYPATNPLVMAVGASDQADDRKSPASPDGECWGSNFGPQISVVAPGVRVPTTDITGNGAGYNQNNGGAMNWACVNYASSGDADGDYIFIFDGTSAATPHVAGLAALLISFDNSLTNVAVREIIEETADKVGTTAYAITPGKPNGTWNQNMGYGRINVWRALRRLSKHWWKEIKDAVDKPVYVEHHKPFWHDVGKGSRWKEKERIDELKGVIGYENPEIFDPIIFEKILTRLDRIEKELFKGRAFIAQDERPEVGGQVARRGGRSKRGRRK